MYALKHFHPELCSCFEQGDMMKLLPQMAARGEVYDVVNADRMLDMVPDAGWGFFGKDEFCADILSRHLLHDKIEQKNGDSQVRI